MASRYDQKTKDEVIAFIQSYNEEKGRGGQSAAVKKWDLNPVTVKSWLSKAGVETPGRGGKKKKAKAGKPGRPAKAAKSGRKPGRPAKAAAGKPGRKPGRKPAIVGGGDLASTLNRMVAIRSEIASLESEYAKLKAIL
jgi:uncharacterized protein YjcR